MTPSRFAAGGGASGAAQRGYKVVVPVDCSAGETVCHEQYAAFHLAKGGPRRYHQQRHADAQCDD